MAERLDFGKIINQKDKTLLLTYPRLFVLCLQQQCYLQNIRERRGMEMKTEVEKALFCLGGDFEKIVIEKIRKNFIDK